MTISGTIFRAREESSRSISEAIAAPELLDWHRAQPNAGERIWVRLDRRQIVHYLGARRVGPTPHVVFMTAASPYTVRSILLFWELQNQQNGTPAPHKEFCDPSPRQPERFVYPDRLLSDRYLSPPWIWHLQEFRWCISARQDNRARWSFAAWGNRRDRVAHIFYTSIYRAKARDEPPDQGGTTCPYTRVPGWANRPS